MIHLQSRLKGLQLTMIHLQYRMKGLQLSMKQVQCFLQHCKSLPRLVIFRPNQWNFKIINRQVDLFIRQLNLTTRQAGIPLSWPPLHRGYKLFSFHLFFFCLVFAWLIPLNHLKPIIFSSIEFLIPTFAKNILLKKYFLNMPLLPLFRSFLISWGYAGHEKISHEAYLSYPQDMSHFFTWTDFLAAHASDADERKAWDPDEGIKHYIDIDNYQQFINTGTIPMTLDSVIDIYGYNFVYDQGILPWATLTTFDSLVACMARHDWTHAKYFAADLGHYVADGHMPLHITRNYNGQYSGNDGIHSRFESTMINSYINQISYEGFDLQVIGNVNQYIFNYLYSNYVYVDSVLMADDHAQSISGNTNSAAYRQALWQESQGFTIRLFANASHTLAELIYNAWLQAGSPSMTAAIEDQSLPGIRPVLYPNTPNPFRGTTTIRYSVPENMDVQLFIRDSEGILIDTLWDGARTSGEYICNWNGGSFPGGIYYLVFHAANWVEVKKLVLLDR